MAALVEQEIIVHLGQTAGLMCQSFDGRDSFSGALACLDNEFLQVTNPRTLHGRRLCGQSMFNGRQTHRIKSCQFTQRKNLVEMVKLSQPILCVGQQYPWSEEHEVIEGVPALSDECACPPSCWTLGGSLQARQHFFSGCRQLVKGELCRRERRRPGLIGGFQIGVKLRERGRGGFPYGILEDSKCVAESLQKSHPQNFLIGEGEQTRPQCQ